MKKIITTSAVIASLVLVVGGVAFATEHEVCATPVTITSECDQPEDICPNIEGNQSEVPEGMVKNDEGNCVEPPAEEPPTETPPAEDPPVDEAPVEEAPITEGK